MLPTGGTGAAITSNLLLTNYSRAIHAISTSAFYSASNTQRIKNLAFKRLHLFPVPLEARNSVNHTFNLPFVLRTSHVFLDSIQLLPSTSTFCIHCLIQFIDYYLSALYFTRGVLHHNHVPPYHTVDKTQITLRMKTEDNTN